MHVFQVSKLANQSELQKTLDKMRDEQDMEFFFYRDEASKNFEDIEWRATCQREPWYKSIDISSF